jgi:hypothetical protein
MTADAGQWEMGSGIVRGTFAFPAHAVAARSLRGMEHLDVLQTMLRSVHFHWISQHRHRQGCKVVKGCPRCSTMPDTLLLRPCTVITMPYQYCVRKASKLRTRAVLACLYDERLQFSDLECKSHAAAIKSARRDGIRLTNRDSKQAAPRTRRWLIVPVLALIMQCVSLVHGVCQVTRWHHAQAKASARLVGRVKWLHTYISGSLGAVSASRLAGSGLQACKMFQLRILSRNATCDSRSLLAAWHVKLGMT